MTATNFINITPLEDINLCDDLIALFHEYEHHHAQGEVLGGVENKDFKDSTDLSILWEDSERIATIKNIKKT